LRLDLGIKVLGREPRRIQSENVRHTLSIPQREQLDRSNCPTVCRSIKVNLPNG